MKIFAHNGSSGEPLIGVLSEEERCPACSKLSLYVDDEIRWHNARCGLKNREKLKRIYIVGGPGSGKTTLAHKIGTRLGIETHELDLIAFTGPEFAERTLPERLADISSIAVQPAWITEGIFILWTKPLLECADIIVWLDQINWTGSMWRTSRRFTTSALREARNRRGLGKFARFNDYARHLRQLIHVFFSSRAYFATPATQKIDSRQTTAACLAPYKDKVVHCYSDDGIRAFLNYVDYAISERVKE
jgi:hypothetical protein